MIQPKHKMRNEGEQVYSDDMILLCVPSEEDNFIGCAGKNRIVSSQKSPVGWKVEVYTKFITETSNALHGGDLVRFFHKELEGFLSLRANDLHLRRGKDALGKVLQFQYEDNTQLLGVRLKDMGKEHNDSNSVLSIWQVVNEDPKKGSAIEWGEAFRLKHAITGLFIKIKFSNSYLEKHKLYYERGELKSLEEEVYHEPENYLSKMKKITRELADKDDFTVTFTHNAISAHLSLIHI